MREGAFTFTCAEQEMVFGRLNARTLAFIFESELGHAGVIADVEEVVTHLITGTHVETCLDQCLRAAIGMIRNAPFFCGTKNLLFYRPSTAFRSWRRTMYDTYVIISSWKNSQMTPLSFFCRSSDWMARVSDIDGRLSPVMVHRRGLRMQPLKGQFLNVLPYLSSPP